MPALVSNNASGTLASGITSSQTTITLGTGQAALFPTAVGTSVFWATLIDASNNLEIVKVTGVSGDTFTVERGADNTTARSYATGDKVELRPTAALFDAKLDVDTAASTYATKVEDQQKAPLVSPALTGVPTAPTAPAGTVSSQIATTEFVANASANGAYKLIGDLWEVKEAATGELWFSASGTLVAKLDTSGNFTVAGNVTAFGVL